MSKGPIQQIHISLVVFQSLFLGLLPLRIPLLDMQIWSHSHEEPKSEQFQILFKNKFVKQLEKC